MAKKVLSKREIVDLTKYVNIETSEMLSSEFKGKSVVTKERTGLMSISSSDYAVIDSEALLVMAKILNNSDLANVIKMAIVTKTPLNVLFNNNIPHCNETLQSYLQISSESQYIKLMQRLIKSGILYQIKGLIHGQVRVCYILNPYICRKRKTFEERLVSIFSEFKLL